MMKKLFIFDFDGTLAHTIPGISNTMNICLKDYSFPAVTADKIRSFIGKGLANLVQNSLSYSLSGESDRCLSPDLERNFYNHFVDKYKEYCMDGTSLYENILELLQNLSDSHLAVISNKTENMTRFMLFEYTLDSYFSHIIGGDTLDVKKPHPQVFKLLKKDYPAIPLKHCYMIGDSNFDIKFAQNAGIKGIACTWGYGNPENLKNEKPDFTCDTVQDLSHLLLSIQANHS